MRGLPTLPDWTRVAAESLLADPRLLLALGTASLVLASLLVYGRMRRRPAPRSRTEQARSLAERGLTPAEIARHTGLSRDAVALALHVAPAEVARQNPPLAARTAGKNAPPAPAAAVGSFAQVFARKRLEAAA